MTVEGDCVSAVTKTEASVVSCDRNIGAESRQDGLIAVFVKFSVERIGGVPAHLVSSADARIPKIINAAAFDHIRAFDEASVVPFAGLTGACNDTRFTDGASFFKIDFKQIQLTPRCCRVYASVVVGKKADVVEVAIYNGLTEKLVRTEDVVRYGKIRMKFNSRFVIAGVYGAVEFPVMYEKLGSPEAIFAVAAFGNILCGDDGGFKFPF